MIIHILLDTDETYGYWEPLHFILHGVGMQTWEYSPLFAIRTYAFVLPLVPFAHVGDIIGISKINYFFFCKLLLGLLFTMSSKQFYGSVRDKMGCRMANYTFLFLLSSPGIFFCSTALLPSAVCASLVMLSFASWLRGYNIWGIFYGCVAVIWSGWPFVAVVFVPIGVHMVCTRWTDPPVLSNKTEATFMHRLQSVFVLLVAGLAVAVVSAAGAIFIDTTMYGTL